MDKKGKEGGSIFTDRSQTTKTGEAPLRLRIWKKKLIKNSPMLLKRGSESSKHYIKMTSWM